MAALRFLGVLVLMLLALPSRASSAVIYPANPFLTDSDIFVSVDGVIRLEHDTLVPVWFALEGLKTYEPVVTGSLVLVGTNAGMFALDIETGMMRWHIPSATTLYSPIVAGRTGFVSGVDGSVRAVDLSDGAVRWNRSLSSRLLPPVVLAKGVIVGSEGGRVWDLDRDSGRTAWKRTLKQRLSFHPVAGPTGLIHLYATGGRLLALDAADGHTHWSRQLDGPGTVIGDASQLYVGQFNGQIAALRPDTGDIIWKRHLPKLSTSVPLRLLAKALVVTTAKGGALFLDPHSGKALQAPAEEESPAPSGPEPTHGGGKMVSAVPH